MPLVATRGGASAFGLGWSASGAGEELGGMVLLTPTSIDVTGTSGTINTNGSVEFTSVTALRLNGVFSANYDNYLVNMRFSTTGATAIQFRLSSGGTDNATAGSYVRQYIDSDGSTVSAARQSYPEWGLTYAYGVQRAGAEISFYGPHLAQPTAVRAVHVGDVYSAGLTDVAGTHNQSASYDGFNFWPSAYVLSGLVSVYGLVGA
jgi:hypothetical protein